MYYTLLTLNECLVNLQVFFCEKYPSQILDLNFFTFRNRRTTLSRLQMAWPMYYAYIVHWLPMLSQCWLYINIYGITIDIYIMACILTI